MLKPLQKFLRRVQIINSKVSETANTDEEMVWEWLGNVIKTLGHDGMSSEESDIEEDIEVVLRVKKMPWRRDINKELHLIDSARLHAPKKFGAQGSKPMRRYRGSDNQVTNRAVVQGLPSTFYDGEWLRAQRNKWSVVKISREEFNWMNIITSDE